MNEEVKIKKGKLRNIIVGKKERDFTITTLEYLSNRDYLAYKEMVENEPNKYEIIDNRFERYEWMVVSSTDENGNSTTENAFLDGWECEDVDKFEMSYDPEGITYEWQIEEFYDYIKIQWYDHWLTGDYDEISLLNACKVPEGKMIDYFYVDDTGFNVIENEIYVPVEEKIDEIELNITQSEIDRKKLTTIDKIRNYIIELLINNIQNFSLMHFDDEEIKNISTYLNDNPIDELLDEIMNEWYIKDEKGNILGPVSWAGTSRDLKQMARYIQNTSSNTTIGFILKSDFSFKTGNINWLQLLDYSGEVSTWVYTLKRPRYTIQLKTYID